MQLSTSATKALAAGANLATAVSVALGSISADNGVVATGDGSADKSAPLQHFVQFTDATGVQTVNLGALTGLLGAAVDFAAVRELVVQNQATDATHVLKVRPAATNGFPGDLDTVGATDRPELTVQAGGFGVYANKPLGAPHDVATNGTIEVDFGANTFSAKLIIKGNG